MATKERESVNREERETEKDVQKKKKKKPKKLRKSIQKVWDMFFPLLNQK